ncbi:F-box protein At2g16365 isoform X1 [Nicotiana tomentosiformis]|uniref:F-box protein At2g16365 isoform X1 n=3 Tax=Nicotiana tomentosiformis TaxID=4098 RepID=UPI00051C174E|nr:F-box protein At2g16365 isoform X1 [Nicotiana tomentosiformis]XP_018623239.1 F-box protein At2g16365 isoform X1 [Nicotiana tomentosiformis]XP_033509552.1 F-box protein At2g16365 isoform X1 [Nicotiana tomentosiformis]
MTSAGMSSSPLKRESEMDENAPTHLALGCPRKEIGCKNVIPDMNLEPPAPIDNLEPTSSRTRSLDLRSLLGHNEQASSLKADFSPVVLLEQEPGGRWVKRLKMSASGSFSVGTKSSNLSGNTSHEKANKFLSKIAKVTITGSELTAGKLHGEELMAREGPPALARNSASSSKNVMKKDLELLTSQSWMRRWLHNRIPTAQKRPQPVVVSTPRGSKLEVDDFQKKQFPSIAAMALMGKALTGFQPCEFQKRGPYVVWRNTGVSEPT